MSAVERRWAMIRVRAGDYLLPSNDKTTLWRLATYEEHGDAEWQDGDGRWHKIRGTFWAVYRYEHGRRSFPDLDAPEWTGDDFLDWDRWVCHETSLATRAAAIDSVLRAAL